MKCLKNLHYTSPASGDTTSIEIVAVSVVMVVEKSSGQEQEVEDMNERLRWWCRSRRRRSGRWNWLRVVTCTDTLSSLDHWLPQTKHTLTTTEKSPGISRNICCTTAKTHVGRHSYQTNTLYFSVRLGKVSKRLGKKLHSAHSRAIQSRTKPSAAPFRNPVAFLTLNSSSLYW